MPSIATLLLLSAVCGLLGLDATGAFQVMVSRPLVVGGVVGGLLGQPALGLAVGSLVEMLWMGGVPIGSVVPPDGTTAAAMAAAAAILLRDPSRPDSASAAAALGMLAAVPVGVLGARAEILQRGIVDRMSRTVDKTVENGSLKGVMGILFAALGLAWLRGALVCAFSLGVGLPALGWILNHLPHEGLRALRWCFWLFWLLGMAEVVNYFWERRSLKFAAAVGIGMAVFGSQAWFGVGQGWILAAALAGAFAAGLWRWIGSLRGRAL